MPRRLVLPDPHLRDLDLGTEGQSRPDELIAALGGWQWRNVAHRQLRAIGLSAGAISRRIQRGNLHPGHRGVYTVGSRGLTKLGEWIAAVLACSVGTMLAYRSAAELRGYLPARYPIHVTVPGNSRPREGFVVHRSRLPPGRDLAVYSRIPTTAVPRLFIDLAASESPTILRRAFAEADRRGDIEMAVLHAACRPTRGRRGIASLIALIEEAVYPEFTRSDGEEAFAEFCEANGLPRPATNEHYAGEEVDASWPPSPFLVELDSWRYHRGRFSFERDREKIERLQVAGYTVLPVTPRRMRVDPAGLAASLRTLLRRFGVLPPN